ncbi:MAG: hypothetical protein DA408_13090 [Bacteroidetes bacterium]|nr:MAG: hypothetical protein C7N36_11385 [Bacteroidota bacterium]PTM11650.1 MAG: hypothetical protein DA408_13090 [Bacteroidota bacterium]
MQRRILLAFLAVSVAFTNLQAQYFGHNKPNYENFDFKVLQSPHFELYHYLDNAAYTNAFLAAAEAWYQQHLQILEDTLPGRNPIILYANHADFQQTNTIGSSIGVGTGGVTEALKNRVIMPVAMSEQQTDHVLGHELVHAFQYDMILNGDSTSLRNLGNLPLWMVEGLAEYLSLGSVDAHTAMWMRDAVLHDDFPTLKQLNNSRYFPYRYGQMFWVFVTGLKGDDIIAPFFRETAKYGFDPACRKVLGMTEKDLSKIWKSAIEDYYRQMINGREEQFVGKEIISKDNAGRINIAPEISPNGRYVIFLSEKDVFGIDLYLADARTGEIVRKVAKNNRSGHIDDFSYIESAGTWSPNSREFAYVGVAKGNNILLVSNSETGKTTLEAEIPGVPAFTNPAWSPDGRTIVVTGLVNGQVDLYAYDIRTRKVTQLTNDVYSEMHPSWSADGARLYFATDEESMRKGERRYGKYHFNIAVREVAAGITTNYDFFAGADNFNPEEDANGNIVFLSDRDGYRNLYRYTPGTGELTQLTDLLTGVSGITAYAPAFSIDRQRNRLVYTYFSSQGYRIYGANAEDLLALPVAATAVDLSAATLPRVNSRAPQLVDPLLASTTPAAVTTVAVPYKPKFKLDYVGGGGGVGIGTSQAFGTTTGVAGGVDLLFSDIMGENQFFTSIAMNGELIDVGGVVAYINREQRINWGVSLSHQPFRSYSGSEFEALDTLDLGGGNLALVDRQSLFETRYFQEQLGGFAQLPISTTLRVELNAAYSLYSGRVDRRDYFYRPFSYVIVAQDRTKLASLPGFNIGQVEAALVGDNSSFGLTSPLSGQRYRLAVGKYFDAFNFTSLTADYRRYQFLRPVSLAFRATHFGRYGGNSEDLFPQYLGYPWYVRGLSTQRGQETFLASGRNFDELTGSKILVTSVEVRLPFTGPEQLALVKSGAFFSDLNLFIDGGIAWTKNEQLSGPIYTLDRNGEPLINPETGKPFEAYGQAKPIFTAGISTRINLFGALIIEPYYAFPLVKNTRGSFGINLIPGW